MVNAPEGQRVVIDALFEKYKSNGYITEDETLDLMIEHSLSLVEQEQTMDELLTMGVLIRNSQDDLNDLDDEDQYDRSRTYYEDIFSKAIEIDPGLTDFIKEVRQIRAPQNREWMKLLPQAKAGYSYAIKRMVEMYLRNVIKIALSNWTRYDLPIADKIQVGVTGIIIAIESYEMGKQQGSFPSYAPLWIQQTISRAIDNQARTIRIPSHMFVPMNKISRISKLLFQELGRKPALEELASEMLMPVEKVSEILMLTQESVSLDNCDEQELSDCGAFDEEMFESVAYKMLCKALNEVLRTLKPREQMILTLRFGLGGGEPMTLEEVGQVYNVTRERIRQIEAKALRKLRHPSRSKCLRDFW